MQNYKAEKTSKTKKLKLAWDLEKERSYWYSILLSENA